MVLALSTCRLSHANLVVTSRLDLRPEEGEGEGGETEHDGATQLGVDMEVGELSRATHRRSVLFELRRLRHATVEERIEALRRYQTEQRQGSSRSNEEESHSRARLTDRLKDRFHIRTRAGQRSSSGQEVESSSGLPTSGSRG